jgi:hypothetical protein
MTLALILALGIGLRAGYLAQPYYQRDEGVTTAVAAGLDYPHRWTTNWINYAVPREFHFDEFNFSSYHYLAHGWLIAAERIISREHQLTVLRALNLSLSLATLLFTAFAVKRTFGWLAGAFAAAVVAVLPILVQDAHYARCDSMLTAGVASLVWLIAPDARKTRWHWAGAGAVAGWLVACKFSLLLLGPLLLGGVIAANTVPSAGWPGMRRISGWLVLGGSLGFAFGMPGAISDPHAFWRGVKTLRSYYAGFHPPYSLPDHGPVMGSLVVYLVIIIGSGTLVLAGLGALYAWRHASRIWVAGLVLTLLVPVLVFGSQTFLAERNVSPFLPLLALLAGSGFAWIVALTRSLPGKAGRVLPWMAAMALLMTLVSPFRLSLRMVARGFSLEEYRTQIALIGKVRAETAKQTFVFCREGLTDAESFAAAEAAVRAGPTVFAIYDFQDANSKEYISRLAQQYSGRVLAMREGLFPELPCCTLTTMISARVLVMQCRPSK